MSNAKVLQVDGRTWLKVSDGWKSQYAKKFKNAGCDSLWLYSYDILDQIDTILNDGISFTAIHLMGKFPDFKLLEDMHWLKEVNLDVANTYAIDFSQLTTLQDLYAPQKNIKELSQLPVSLCSLNIHYYQESDLQPLAYLSKLCNLELAPCSKLLSFKGLEHLNELNKLEIAYAPHLENVDALQYLKLKNLRFEKCGVVNVINSIAETITLEKIALDNSGKISSLIPLLSLKNLKELTFIESTNIQDGRIQELASLPNIRDVWFQNRKHYDITREEIAIKIKDKRNA